MSEPKPMDNGCPYDCAAIHGADYECDECGGTPSEPMPFPVDNDEWFGDGPYHDARRSGLA